MLKVMIIMLLLLISNSVLADCLTPLLKIYGASTPNNIELHDWSINKDAQFLDYIAIIIAIESGFRTNAKNGMAIGLMQITPIALKEVHKKWATGSNNLNDAKYNIMVGTYYYQLMLDKTGSYIGALIAYNGGMRQYKRWLKHGTLVKETANYIVRAMSFLDNVCTKGEDNGKL